VAFVEMAAACGLNGIHGDLSGSTFSVLSGGGLAGDFDGDGWTDVFVVGGSRYPDQMYRNLGLDADGHVVFADVTAAWGLLRAAHQGYGPAAGDFDNDGDLDLYVTSFGPAGSGSTPGFNRLYRNDGAAGGGRVFVDVTDAAGVAAPYHKARCMGASFGDYDLDGDLDLFVAAYDYRPESQRLMRNNGDGTFTDVTQEAGLWIPEINGYFGRFVDMNGDRYPELILIGDTGTSKYLVNLGPDSGGVVRFADRTPDARGIQTANGMGLSVGDINADGRLDMYVSGSYWSQFSGPGNVLMVQEPDGTFTNVAHEWGAADGHWSWASAMEDFDHDADLDIAVVNGWSGPDFSLKPAKLFEQTAPGVMTNVAASSGFAGTIEGRGMAAADFDRDGDVDLAVFPVGGPTLLWDNQRIRPGEPVPSDAAWTQLVLDTRARPGMAPFGQGALVTVSAGGREFVLAQDGKANYGSQGETVLHAGLGGAAAIDWVRVAWADGSFTTLTGLPINARLSIAAPAQRAERTADGVLDSGDLMDFVVAYVGGDRSADHDGSGTLAMHDAELFVEDFLTAR
jgi:hypothetical protein